MEPILSVLIVDDEASIRNGLMTVLPWEEIGFTVIGTAKDGMEALELIDALNPHVVITDIRMPRWDGLKLIKEVTNKNLPTKFIILSGYDDFKYAQKAMHYHVSSYLLKPINCANLLEELSRIRATLLKEMKESAIITNTKHQLMMRNRALKENFYLKLLENEYKKESEIESQLLSLQLPISISPVRVLVFTYDLLSNPSEFNSEDNSLFQSAAINIMEEIMEDLPCVIFSKETSSIIAIINVSSNDYPSLEIILEFSQKIIKYIYDFSGVSIYLGIGKTTSSILTAGNSYKNALEALSYRIYETKQTIFDSSIISTQPVPIISPKKQHNEEIIDAIYRGDTTALETQLHDFFHSLFYVPTPPPTYIRGMCIFLMINVQTGLTVYIGENPELFIDVPFIKINQFSSFREIKNWLTDKFFYYIDYIQKNCVYQKDPVIQKAIDYVNENIYKKIRVEDVAAHVGLSDNYFSVYFKEKTKDNFKTYVQTLKMDKAKERLKVSNISINELSFLLGYEDYRSFNRAFKKDTGLTPSEYQQRYQTK